MRLANLRRISALYVIAWALVIALFGSVAVTGTIAWWYRV